VPFPEDRASSAPAAVAAPPLDFARTFRFVFDDPDWVRKMLLGGLFTALVLLIVGLFYVAGYTVRLVRRSARGETRPLPDWDDMGGLFGEGVPAIGAYLAHVLPLVLVPFLVLAAGAVALGGLSSLGDRSAEAASAMGGLFSLFILIFYAVFAAASLALMFYFPAALVRLALLGRFGAAFEWRENVAFIRRNFSGYLLAIGFYLIASFVTHFGVLLCCVGVFPVLFWSVCVLGYALGQVARGDATLLREAAQSSSPST
jgi:hypothetical protein